MWTKTLKIKFKGKEVFVQVWLSDTGEDGKEVVTIQSMVNEFYLIYKVVMESRDAAYDFIKHYPVSMAQSFVTREAYSVGAIDN